MWGGVLIRQGFNVLRCAWAQEAERHAEAATRDRLRFLAEITNLKAALRDMSGRSDSASLIGKLHLELDHCRYEVGRTGNRRTAGGGI